MSEMNARHKSERDNLMKSKEDELGRFNKLYEDEMDAFNKQSE